MTEFIDGDTKTRHAVADHMIDLCADLLDNPEIQDATNGLAKEARSLLDLLYVPNKRDGYHRISGKKFEGHGIPLIVTMPGERAKVRRLAKYALHPLQEERLQGVFADHGIDTSEEEYTEMLEGIKTRYKEYYGNTFKGINDDGSWIAYVYAPTSDVRLRTGQRNKKVRYMVNSSPAVFMRSNIGEVDDAGDLLFHELIHVQQCLTRIIYRSRDTQKDLYRNELEAYSNAAIAQSIHYNVDIDENPLEFHHMYVESIRRRINADNDDPYAVTDELLAALKQAGRTLN